MEEETPEILSDKEIDDIFSIIPPLRAAIKDVAENARNEMVDKLSKQLKEYPLKKSKIERLKEIILHLFYRSLIAPGESVGLRTGEAVGQQLTQINLSSFHSAGLMQSITSGIDSFREIFNASKKRKREITSIHFREPLTFRQVLEKRKDIIGMTLKDIVVSYEILENSEKTEWENRYIDIFSIKEPDNTVCLTFILDKNLMYSHKITTYDVANVIESSGFNIAIPSPTITIQPMIKIYPIVDEIRKEILNAYGKDKKKNKEIEKKTEEEENVTEESNKSSWTQYFNNADSRDLTIQYIESSILINMDQICVKGVESIKSLYPVIINVWSSIRHQEHLANGNWKIWYDKIFGKINGIPIQKVLDLLKLSNFDIVISTIDYCEVKYPNNWLRDYKKMLLRINIDEDLSKIDISKISPGLYIETLVQHLSGRDNLSENPVYLASRYVYAEAEGINLSKILSLEYVKTSCTISNNFHDILDALGIEACRNYITHEIHKMLSSNSIYISPRFINTIADFMTNLGSISQITSRGVARQKRGVFADASFEHSLEFIKKAAMGGQWEKVESTSSCIFFGKRGFFGTGSFRLKLVQTDIKHSLSMKENEDEESLLNDIEDQHVSYEMFGNQVGERDFVTPSSDRLKIAISYPPEYIPNPVIIPKIREGYLINTWLVDIIKAKVPTLDDYIANKSLAYPVYDLPFSPINELFRI